MATKEQVEAENLALRALLRGDVEKQIADSKQRELQRLRRVRANVALTLAELDAKIAALES